MTTYKALPRRILLAGLCVAAVFVLTACGSASSGEVHLDNTVAKPVLLKNVAAPRPVSESEALEEALPEETMAAAAEHEEEQVSGSGSKKNNSGHTPTYSGSSSGSGSTSSGSASSGNSGSTSSGSEGSENSSSGGSSSGESSGTTSSGSENSSSQETTPPATTCPPLPEVDKSNDNLDIISPVRPSQPTTSYGQASAEDVVVTFPPAPTAADVDPVDPTP